MQYDLKDHPSLYIDESAKDFVPQNGNSVVGGYRTLPSPQSDFGWPSPPELDCKPYKCKVLTNNVDSTVIYLESDSVSSPDEDKYKTHQGLKFKRVITMYKASSHVKVEVTMINKGTSTINHGIWDITQSDCTNKGNVDTENFWVYFKKNPTSKFGGKGYIHYINPNMGQGDDSTQWRPEVAPGSGVMGVQYLQSGDAKIGADCSAGWIAFVDQLDGYAYIKKFAYEKGKPYPDSGASVQVYTYSGMNMIEVEVLGPLTSLAKNDSTKLVENWFSARSNGPVLDVNDAGLITSRLTAQHTADSMTIKGTYGIFYSGKVKCTYINNSNTEISSVDSFTVIPTDSLKISKKIKVPDGAKTLRLEAYNNSGKKIGTLDTIVVPPATSINQITFIKTMSKNSLVTSNNGNIQVQINTPGEYSVKLFSLQGKLMQIIKGNMASSGAVSIPLSSQNTCIVQICGNGWVENSVVYTQR
jgi:hypothetical protein